MPGFADRCPAWSSIYDHAGGYGDGSGLDIAVAVVAGEGLVYSAGYSRDDGSDSDAVVVAHDPATGARRWVHRYDGVASAFDAALDAALSVDGERLYVAGTQDSASGIADYLILALDAGTGERLWSARYDHGEIDFGQGLAVGSPNVHDERSGADRVYVTGQSQGDDYDSATVAIDGLTGQRLWSARYAEASGVLRWDSTYAVAVDPSGERLVVAGERWSEESMSFDALVVAYDTGIHDDEEVQSGGDELWVARRPRGTTYRVAFAAGGARVVAGGTSFRSGSMNLLQPSTDYLVWGLDPGTGATEWSDAWSGFSPNGGENILTGLAVAPDGSRAYVTGVASGVAEGDDDIGTVAYDASSGQRAWTSRYGAPGHVGDAGLSVAVAPDGERVYVSGISAPALDRWLIISNQFVFQGVAAEPPQGDGTVLALDRATGRAMWTGRHNAGAHGEEAGFAFDVAVAPDGDRVFAAGWTLRRVDMADEDPTDARRNRYDLTTAAYATS